MGLFTGLQRMLDATRALDFLAPLAIRLYLAPMFWIAGTHKLADMTATIARIGGTGLPYSEYLAWATAITEIGGAVLLLVGLGVRWVSIPLMAVMATAAVTEHLQNGWLRIADATGLFATDRTRGAIERLDQAKQILQAHGDYAWLTANGKFVVLNNGIELSVTYFILLLVLFFFGAGRFFSVDYWTRRATMPYDERYAV